MEQGDASAKSAVPMLICSASKVFLFDNMATSLLSISQLCDDGCITFFDKDQVVILKDNQVVLRGQRDPVTRLWLVDLHADPLPPLPGPNILQYAANAAIAKETQAERIAFLHWCAGSPALSTWCRAIDAGYYKSWPGLTAAPVRKHIPQSTPMHKGHLDQQRKNLRSTKPRQPKATPRVYPGADETPTESHPSPSEHRSI